MMSQQRGSCDGIGRRDRTQLPVKKSKQFRGPRQWEEPGSLPAVSVGAAFGLVPEHGHADLYLHVPKEPGLGGWSRDLPPDSAPPTEARSLLV